MKYLCNVNIVLLLAFAVSPICAQVQIFDNRDDWIAAAGGGFPDLNEDFNSVTEDLFYFLDEGAEVGFLNFTAPLGNSIFQRIDAEPFWIAPGPVDDTPFANLRSATGAFSTGIEFQPVSAIGFEYINNAIGLPGNMLVFDANDNLLATMLDPGQNVRFIGLVAAAGEELTYLEFRSPNTGGLLAFSSDNFSAFSIEKTAFVPPSTYSVFRGIELNGSPADFVDSDDTKAAYNPGFVVNSGEAPLWLVFDSNAPAVNEFRVESSAQTPGLSYTVEAFNWNAGVFEEIGVENESFNMDTVLEFPISPSHIDNSGNVKSRVGWRSTGFVINFPWIVEVDQVGWHG